MPLHPGNDVLRVMPDAPGRQGEEVLRVSTSMRHLTQAEIRASVCKLSMCIATPTLKVGEGVFCGTHAPTALSKAIAHAVLRDRR